MQANNDFLGLTVTAEVHILLVEAEGNEKHFLLFAALADSQDFLLGLELLAARPAAKHGDATLRTQTAIRVGNPLGARGGGVARQTTAPHLVEEQQRLGAELPDALVAGEPGCVHGAVLLGSECRGSGLLGVPQRRNCSGDWGRRAEEDRGGSGRPPCSGGLILGGGGAVGQFGLCTAVRLLHRDIDLDLGIKMMDSFVNHYPINLIDQVTVNSIKKFPDNQKFPIINVEETYCTGSKMTHSYIREQ